MTIGGAFKTYKGMWGIKMSLDWLRKRIKEKIENGTLGTSYTAPELPGMDNLNQPAAPNPVDTYNPPEVDVPTAQTPKTTPISAPATNTAKNTSVPPKNSTTGNNKKVDPKTGQAGAKALDDITVDNPQLVEGVGNDDLVDAYNAGLNGTDMSRETRDNAAVGGYLEQIEAMYNAGLQDARISADSINNMKNNETAVNIKTQTNIDIPENLGYTSGNTTGNTGADTVDEPIQYTDTATNYGASNTNSSTSSSRTNTDFQTDHNFAKYGQGEDEDDVLSASTSNNTSTSDGNSINLYEQDYNYIEDMMFLNGAASSADPSVQMAYQYITNSENRGKQIPPEVMKAYEEFMKGINTGEIGYQNTTQAMRDAQRKRSHEIAMGNADINNYDVDDLKKRNETLLNPTADMSAISNAFGELDDDSGDYHLGIDIKKAGGKNSNIYTPFYGEIVFNGWAKEVTNNDDNGYMIIIKHQININGKDITFYSAYCHLDPTGTEGIGLTNNHVYPGELIGIMGNTGHSTGPHLHFTIFTTTMKIDKNFNSTGYTPKKINGYTCPSASGNTIFYDPEKFLETNGAILG